MKKKRERRLSERVNRVALEVFRKTYLYSIAQGIYNDLRVCSLVRFLCTEGECVNLIREQLTDTLIVSQDAVD